MCAWNASLHFVQIFVIHKIPAEESKCPWICSLWSSTYRLSNVSRTVQEHSRNIFSKGEHYWNDSLCIKQTDALNSNFYGITTLHVSGSLSAHHQEFLAVYRLWYILCSCDESFATSTSSILLLVANDSSRIHKMYQSRYAAKNSWWWAERMPETCRVVIPINWNSVHVLVLLTRNLL
jgi:hypothetical protein